MKERGWHQFSIISIFGLCAIILYGFFAWNNEKVVVAKAESNVNVLDDDGNSTIEAQDYEAWTKPVTSYLEPVQNGFMGVRFISKDDSGENGKIVVSYYDDSFHITDRKVIADELPIWGGFGVSSDAYYLVTGQKNEEESDSKEVIRITKYDKNWNRIGSAGAKGCNVYEPFDASGVRMVFYKQYLVMKTGRLIYLTPDGVHHQVQLSLELDTENMTMVNSGTDYGYVSHSFNQFLDARDNKIISVEQGDAYPRGLILFETENPLFQNLKDSTLREQIVMEFPGELGENQTGASVGGFESSRSSYLISGNSVVQDERNLERTTRNIFVASVDRENLNQIEINWLTSYQEGDGTVTTPHMVKFSNEKYMVLWSRGDVVYYTLVDGEGKQIGEIYQHEGHLSDCKPILKDGSIYWYTANGVSMDFYTISMDDLSDLVVKKTVNGHQYTVKSVKSGRSSLVCAECGHIETMNVLTSFEIWHNEKGPWEEYWGGPNGTLKINKGDKVYFWITFDQKNVNTEMNVKVEKPEVVSYTATNDDHGYFTALEDGITKVTVTAKWNPDLKKEFRLQIGERDRDSIDPDEIPTSFEIWHNEKGPWEEYWGGPNGTLQISQGDKVYFWITFDKENVLKDMDIEVEKPKVVSYTATSDDRGYFTALADGTTKVTVALKWNPNLKKEFTLKIGKGSSTNTNKVIPKLSKKTIKIKKGKKAKLILSGNSKKVIWSVTKGKKYIALKNKSKTGVTIQGKKKGTAKVQAKIGTKKLICAVQII